MAVQRNSISDYFDDSGRKTDALKCLNMKMDDADIDFKKNVWITDPDLRHP